MKKNNIMESYIFSYQENLKIQTFKVQAKYLFSNNFFIASFLRCDCIYNH